MQTKIRNPRLYDVYQAGLLFYRLLENGEWPFGDVIEYCTGDGTIRPMANHEADRGVKDARELIGSMLSLRRPRRGRIP